MEGELNSIIIETMISLMWYNPTDRVHAYTFSIPYKKSSVQPD